MAHHPPPPSLNSVNPFILMEDEFDYMNDEVPNFQNRPLGQMGAGLNVGRMDRPEVPIPQIPIGKPFMFNANGQLVPLPARGPIDDRRAKNLLEEAAQCVGPYSGGTQTNVQSWIRTFNMHRQRLALDEDLSLRLFFRLVKIPEWLTQHMQSDAERQNKASIDKWLDRLGRAYALKKSTLMSIVRNRKQGENETPETFVREVERMLRSADPKKDAEDVLPLIETNIHPKYKAVYETMAPTVRTLEDAINALTSAMSPAMAGLRSVLAQVTETTSTATSTASSTTTTATVVPSGCGRGAGRPYNSNESYQQSGQRQRSQSDYQYDQSDRQQGGRGTCFQCNLPGHYQRECPALIAYQQQEMGRRASFPPYGQPAHTNAAMPTYGMMPIGPQNQALMWYQPQVQPYFVQSSVPDQRSMQQQDPKNGQ